MPFKLDNTGRPISDNHDETSTSATREGQLLHNGKDPVGPSENEYVARLDHRTRAVLETLQTARHGGGDERNDGCRNGNCGNPLQSPHETNGKTAIGDGAIEKNRVESIPEPGREDGTYRVVAERSHQPAQQGDHECGDHTENAEGHNKDHRSLGHPVVKVVAQLNDGGATATLDVRDELAHHVTVARERCRDAKREIERIFITSHVMREEGRPR